jgi:hypothetical protein
VRQVEKAEGLSLGNDDLDPRPKLRALGERVDQFVHEASVVTIQNLLKQWGATSPAALKVARALNELLEAWARMFVETVGLVRDENAS